MSIAPGRILNDSNRRGPSVGLMSTLDVDILHPTAVQESHSCKKKTLIPNPRSAFVELCCASCAQVTTAFSHSDAVVVCTECNSPLAFPTGGKVRLVEGVKSRELYA